MLPHDGELSRPCQDKTGSVKAFYDQFCITELREIMSVHYSAPILDIFRALYVPTTHFANWDFRRQKIAPPAFICFAVRLAQVH